ncbi:MAG: PSD1 and planctomycete cytochrome C domain-containing protein [Opitutaceae bacterium]|nr:PSD1 and planctomycete cytochrome C domain-containing protein [Opitutaceae bacterium]
MSAVLWKVGPALRAGLGLVSFAFVASAADLPPEHVEFFETKVRPILVEHCYKCHSTEAGKSKGDLLLDTRDALRKGGVTGAAIVPGDPAKSLLIEAVRHTTDDLQMPPKEEGGKLAPEKIAALEEWVRLGAPDPRTGGKAHPTDIAAARKHWAFQPVAKRAPPAVKHRAWVRTPVDAFVLAQLEAKKLAPAAPADPRTLLRRVTYDLTGLPPTVEETEAFLRDLKNDPRAYDRAVDRLLASPRYGERWARVWLDVARYADTQGYLVGNAERRFPFSHTYRDYVIRAFNDDKPFDQFIVEQLAADRLPLGEDKSALAAMGFLTLGRRFLGNQNDIIDDRIDVVTRGLLGLTVACARCHDHKFDPIPTRDYYSLHGVFASSEEPAEKPLLGPLVESPEYRRFLEKTAEAEEKVKARARSEVEKFLSDARAKLGDYLLGAHELARAGAEVKLDLFAGPRKLHVELLKRWQAHLATDAAKNDPVLAPWFALAALPEEGFDAAAKSVVATWAGVGPDLGQADSSENGLSKLRPYDAAVVEAFFKAEKPLASLKDAAALYNRLGAETNKPAPSESDRSPAALRQLLHAEGGPAHPGYDATAALIKRQIDDRTSALRREVVALQWTEPGAPLRAMALADKAKPAHSRVMLRGNPASRGPEAPRQFLEVLSPEQRTPFTDGSGRLELARAIASPANPLTARVFVNRVWSWHFGAPLVRTPSDFGVRTESPVHRDLLDWLAASFAEGGWSVKSLHRAIVLSSAYGQSSEGSAVAAAADPDNQLVHRFNRRRLEFEALRDTLLAASGALDLRGGGLPDDLTKQPFTVRRTVYGFIDRQNLPGMFRTFDFPNPDVSSAQRFATTVPQQALFMMNSPFTQEQARQLMQRPEIAAEKTDGGKVRALYRALLQRAPEADEAKLALAFLQRPVELAEAPPPAATGWTYGYGAFDEQAKRVRDFHPMTVRQDARVSPTAKFPDETFARLSLTATGGHPGRTTAHAAIRRWTAPAKGTVRIEGTLGHANPAGDGVHGRIVLSRTGSLGAWTAHNAKAETKLDAVAVKAGDTIDFVVDSRANANSDSFTWAPSVTFTATAEMESRTWSAKKDFDSTEKPAAPLTRWEELAQVLLLSNEVAFVD